MRVVGLTAFHVRIPLRRPVRHASHVRSHSDNLLVHCVLYDGKEGWGESVPREYVTGETVQTAFELLKASDLRAQLPEVKNFHDAIAVAEELKLNPVPDDDRGCRGNAARCAVELAFLDACGKSFGESFTTLTQRTALDMYHFTESVRYSGVVTSSTGWKLRALALGLRIYGFAQVKTKVGIAGHDDVARLRTIRRLVGSRVKLRVDANEAWPADQAAARIHELEPFDIISVEQPVPHEEVAALADIRKEVSTPIMLDESLCSMTDAENAVAWAWCDRFNLRLSKCGGYIPTLRLAQFARKNNIRCQLGCQVGETAILSAAGRHFAASVGGLTAVEGSYDRHLVTESLGKDDLTFRWGGRAPALTGCGHGARIDPAAVKRVTVRTEALID